MCSPRRPHLLQLQPWVSQPWTMSMIIWGPKKEVDEKKCPKQSGQAFATATSQLGNYIPSECIICPSWMPQREKTTKVHHMQSIWNIVITGPWLYLEVHFKYHHTHVICAFKYVPSKVIDDYQCCLTQIIYDCKSVRSWLSIFSVSYPDHRLRWGRCWGAG